MQIFNKTVVISLMVFIWMGPPVSMFWFMPIWMTPLLSFIIFGVWGMMCGLILPKVYKKLFD